MYTCMSPSVFEHVAQFFEIFIFSLIHSEIIFIFLYMWVVHHQLMINFNLLQSMNLNNLNDFGANWIFPIDDIKRKASIDSSTKCKINNWNSISYSVLPFNDYSFTNQVGATTPQPVFTIKYDKTIKSFLE